MPTCSVTPGGERDERGISDPAVGMPGSGVLTASEGSGDTCDRLSIFCEINFVDLAVLVDLTDETDRRLLSRLEVTAVTCA